MKPRTEKTLVIVATAVLVLGGLGLMLYPRLTDVRYAFEQWRLATFAAVLEPTAEGGIALPDGSVAHLEIPAIGVDEYVVDGTGAPQLNQGPGHYPDTPLPGERGNAAIAGHRTMYGHVFHDLHLLTAGDEIHTGTLSGRASYRVTEVRVVDDSDVGVVAPTSDDRLTLTTCHPIGSAAQRLVVVAVRTD